MTIIVSQFLDQCQYGATQAALPAMVCRTTAVDLTPRDTPLREAASRNRALQEKASTKARETLMSDNPEKLSGLLEAVARDQDVAAFEALFRHFGPKVKTYMLRRTKSAQIAEELMQETMMAVWHKAALFDSRRGSVSAWIYTIARNQFISAYRRENRPEFDPNDPALVPEQVEPADVGLENRQEGERLQSAMLELPDEQRELLQRAFFGDVSHNALSEEFRLPLGTVKSRIRMAIAKLRKSLEERS